MGSIIFEWFKELPESVNRKTFIIVIFSEKILVWLIEYKFSLPCYIFLLDAFLFADIVLYKSL